MKTPFMLIVFVSLFFSCAAYAEVRCKGRLINGSYSKLDIKKYCGEPVMVDSYTKTETDRINDKDVTRCITVDQWYYSFGDNQTTYVIDFEGGFVARVKQGRDKP